MLCDSPGLIHWYQKVNGSFLLAILVLVVKKWGKKASHEWYIHLLDIGVHCCYCYVVHMVHNKSGPLSASGCATELRAALTGPSALPHHKEQQRSQDNTFWPLEERLSNMEEYLQVHNKSECCQKVVLILTSQKKSCVQASTETFEVQTEIFHALQKCLARGFFNDILVDWLINKLDPTFDFQCMLPVLSNCFIKSR